MSGAHWDESLRVWPKTAPNSQDQRSQCRPEVHEASSVGAREYGRQNQSRYLMQLFRRPPGDITCEERHVKGSSLQEPSDHAFQIVMVWAAVKKRRHLP